MKYIVEYNLPYEHVVAVGLDAETAEVAINKAQTLFDDGDIWNDTPETPLISDDFYEVGDAGVPLQFSAKEVIDDRWPDSDESVKRIRRSDAAFQAARILVDAYQYCCVHGGSVELEELNLAYQAALIALGEPTLSISASRGESDH